MPCEIAQVIRNLPLLNIPSCEDVGKRGEDKGGWVRMRGNVVRMRGKRIKKGGGK